MELDELETISDGYNVWTNNFVLKLLDLFSFIFENKWRYEDYLFNIMDELYVRTMLFW